MSQDQDDEINRNVRETTAKMDVMFVGWEPESESLPRKTAPRLHHKKSRTGCQQCRARRVKCNESHPICGSCQRHQTTCIWGRGPTTTRPEPIKTKPAEIKPKVSPQPRAERASSNEPPESKERRFLELRLLHQYMAISASTMVVTMDVNDPKLHAWAISIPQLSFRHNSLLYAICTVGALHLAKEDAENQETRAIYQRYLGMTLREHRDDVGLLSRANADAACLTSAFLRVVNFALLQEREMVPYVPPVEWLRMSSGTGRGLAVAAWKYIADDPRSIMRQMMATAPGMKSSGWLRDDQLLLGEDNRRDFLHLLRRTPTDVAHEPWDEAIQLAYESTVSYIGSIQLAIADQEGRDVIFRRLILFPTMVEPDFIDLVKETRPKALVILAHFFAFLADFNRFWWMGDTGAREVAGIQSTLPSEWLGLMDWPLQTIEDVAARNRC